MILSEESYEKGPVDAYSDEFADDLMKKLEKQTKDIRGVETTKVLEEKTAKGLTSSVPKLPPVIHT